MNWKVSTWGMWELTGSSTTTDPPFEVEITYTCDPSTVPGLVFYAPTPNQGMVKFCRDTFEAHVRLTLWECEYDKETQQLVRAATPLIQGATSTQGGAEIGGGPWWDDWEGTSRVTRTIRFLLRLPSKLPRWKKRT